MVEAGRRAEEQMQHYLKRAFAEDPNVRGLNDVRVQRSGETAQMDHLVIHRFGIVIIESKSVSTAVRVNANGEWERKLGSDWRGMPSPIRQARRQAELLKRLLTDHKTALLDRIVLGMIQSGFTNMALDVVVAVSDHGSIRRPRPRDYPEVVKADQVTDWIRKRLAKYRKMTAALNLSLSDLNEAPRTFGEREVTRIAAFLHSRDKDPFETVAEKAGHDAFAATTVPSVRCRECDGGIRFIDYRHGLHYHFRCRACDAIEAIKVACPRCGKRVRLSRKGRDFSILCNDCDVRVPYFSDTLD